MSRWTAARWTAASAGPDVLAGERRLARIQGAVPVQCVLERLAVHEPMQSAI
jgi:hypothetical protein